MTKFKIVLLTAVYSILFFSVKSANNNNKNQLESSNSISEDTTQKQVLVIDEHFDNNNNNWALYTSDFGNATIENGVFKLGSATDQGNSRFMEIPIESSFFVTEIKFNYAKKGSNFKGMVFNHKDWNNFAYFYVYNNYFSIGYYENGIQKVLTDNFSSHLIETSGDNTLKLKVEANEVTYYINESPVFKDKKFKFQHKNLGFVVGGVGEIEVEHFKVWESIGTAKYLSDNSVKKSGTGFLLSKDGYLITNAHVIEDALNILVEFTLPPLNDKKQYQAKLIGQDKLTDLALLKINIENSDTNFSIPYYLSDNLLDVGAQVFTLGYPLVLSGMGTEIKFSDGRISSRSGYQNQLHSYQTTTPIQPGNSGSPLFNENGNLVGIINASVNQTDNVSYAIKTSYLKLLLENFEISVPVASPNSQTTVKLEEMIKLYSPYIAIIKIN